MTRGFDPYHKWLAILPKDQPPHHYRLLGIELFESDPDVISHAADARMAHIRTFQTGRYSDHSQRILNEIAAAQVCLLNREKKAEYDAQLRQRLVSGGAVAPVAVARPAAVSPAPEAAPDPREPAVPVLGRASSAAAVLARRRRSWQAPTALAVLGSGAVVVAVLAVLATRESNTADRAGIARSRSASAAGAPQPDAPRTANGKSKGEDADPAAEGPRPAHSSKSDYAPRRKRDWPRPRAPAEKPDPAAEDSAPKPEAPEETAPEPRPEDKQPARIPAPDAAARANAEREVRTLYKDELAAAGTDAARLALAGTLVRQGRDTNDNPAAQYVLFTMAADLAAQAGDAQALAEAAEALAGAFAVHPWEVKASALEKAGPGADGESARRCVEAARDAAREAASGDDYGAADRLAKTALNFARKTKDPTLVRDVAAWGREVERLGQRFARVQKDLETLARAPDDPEANLAVGRWYALETGQWAKGVPYLAKGNDPDLAEAARRDLAAPADAAGRQEAGNRWWDLAEKHQGDERLALQGRAVHWYELAAPDLAGLSKTQVEKRMETYYAAGAGGADAAAKKKGDYALAFDGQKSHVVVPNFRYDGSKPLTVEAAVVPESADKSCTVVGNIGAASGWGLGIFDLRQVRLQNCHWAFLFRAQSRQPFPPATGSNAPAAAGGRVMLAAVFDGQEVRFYVNGQKQLLVTPVRGPHLPGPPLVMIGAAPGPGGTPQDHFHGTIEQVRLSLAARYTDNYTPPQRLEKDKLTELLFNFDEGEGTVLRDASGNRRNGRIVGAKWVKRNP